ncbi:MAG: hypothetical protein WDW36_004847 [Sanguina aurantia]
MAKKKAAKKFQDGVMELLPDGTAHLFDTDGKQVYRGKSKCSGGGAAKASGKGGRSSGWEEEEEAEEEDLGKLEMGAWVVEIDQPMDLQKLRSGACFTKQSTFTACTAAAASTQDLPPGSAPTKFKAVAKPLAHGSGQGPAPVAVVPHYLHDPSAAGALVLNETQWGLGQGRMPNGRPAVPVVVDPFVCRTLRPHQKEGVSFMYECVMGLRDATKTGCILADEMGLGKTLQIIALVWTLLKQGPEGRPVTAKVIVVTPATLVQNWAKEVKKWLGSERLQALPLTQGPEAKQLVQDFKLGNIYKVLVVSYETLRKHVDELAGVCGLLVCDEGHRLKAVKGNQTINALLQLRCPRRIVLTGTPVQNNLDEFYALLSFVVPDLLGTPTVFKRVYSDPISRSRDREATLEQRELGASRAEELQAKVGTFVLRRTQDLLTKHLPPLSVYVLFCSPSDTQIQLYDAILRSKAVSSIMGVHGGDGSGSGEDNSLAIITALRKLCNHPTLLTGGAAADDPAVDATAARGGCTTAARQGSSSWLPDTRGMSLDPPDSIGSSGKLAVLEVLLRSILGDGQRCVVVSTSTAMLDLVDRLLCGPRKWRTVRIDGSTAAAERQNIVDAFNSCGVGKVFLLSTRAGGAGLNLVGSSSLVLLDSDWNPAHDMQAMARIWRDGQKQPCTVYRLLSTGTIEEKVYQRQLMKGDLATAAMEAGPVGGATGQGGKSGDKRKGRAGAADRQFTREELRQLFVLNTATRCETRELLQGGGRRRCAGRRCRARPLTLLPPHPPTLPPLLASHPQLPDGSCRGLQAAVSCGLVTCVAQVMRGNAGEALAQDNAPEAERENAGDSGDASGEGEEEGGGTSAGHQCDQREDVSEGGADLGDWGAGTHTEQHVGGREGGGGGGAAGEGEAGGSDPEFSDSAALSTGVGSDLEDDL